jgi:hypothetical protein
MTFAIFASNEIPSNLEFTELTDTVALVQAICKANNRITVKFCLFTATFR